MRLLTRKWLGRLLLGFVPVAIAAVPATASATPFQGPPVVGHVYVDDNTTGVNTIAGFDRHADGSLTPEPESPFTSGGAEPERGSPRKAPFNSRPTIAS